MADKKISALPSATTPLAGTEVLPIVQSGVTDKVSVANLTAGRDTSALVYRAGLAPNDQSGLTAPSGGLFLKNNGTAGANTVVARFSDGTYPNSALPTVEFAGFGGGNVYSAAIWGTQYGGIVFATANTFGGTYTANLTLANGVNGDATVNKGNLVVGTAGKGVTTGGATALGLGVNNAVDAVTIDASNNVRVGTNTFIVSSSEKFSIDCGAGNGLTTKTSGGASTWNHFVWNAGTSGNNGFIEFGTEASYTARGSITYNRGAGQVAYNVTSDARLKTNVADAADAGEIVDAIKVRQFDWAETGVRMHYGFVAQELYKAAPIAVTKPDDDDAMWSVDYSKLVPILVKEIQSLRARVAQLEGN